MQPPINKIPDYEWCGEVVDREYGPSVYCQRPKGHAIDPNAYLQGHGERRILRNALRCNSCGDEIESTFRHDYRSCKCGNAVVDGGRAYLRHGCRDGWDSITDLSEFEV